MPDNYLWRQVCKLAVYRISVENAVFILFDRPSGKDNPGISIYSCDAFGVKTHFRTGHSVDYYDPEVIVSSMGSFFVAPFYDLPRNSDADDLI